jgi:chromosome segregation ATPase
MSETKKKAGGETPNGVKAGGKPGRFREKLNQVFRLIKEIDTNPEGIDEYDQVLEERDFLNKALSEKEAQHKKKSSENAAAVDKLKAELQDVRNAKDVMWREFRVQLEDLKSKTDGEAQLRGRIDQLEKEKKVSQARADTANKQLEKLKVEFDTYQDDQRRLSDQLKSAELDRSKLSHQLALREADLAEAREQLGDERLTDLDVDQM